MLQIRKLHTQSGLSVSPNGDIFGPNGKRTPTPIKNGYLYLGVWDKGEKKYKNYSVARLVAETFIDNPQNKPIVHHKDHNINNNDVSNLEWVTHQENMEYAGIFGKMNRSGEKNPNSKLSDYDIDMIKQLHTTGEYTQVKLAEMYDVSKQHIWRILNKKMRV